MILIFDVACHLRMPDLEMGTFQIFFANMDLILAVPWLTSQDRYCLGFMFVIRSNDHGKVSICVSNACVPSSCNLNW